MTGITREQAAQAVAALFGTTARQTRESRTYDPWEVIDNEGKKWRFVYDGSIHMTHRECRRQAVVHDSRYSVEMNSPKLEYSEMKKLQEVIRTLRHAGAVVNDSCGMHVHVDASGHTPRSLRNALSIMYSKEDLIFKAIGAKPERISQYCQYSRENVVRTVRALSPHLTMEQLKQAWYGVRDGSNDHYNWTRYYALNLHSVFYHGTVEWRCFESTLHAGVVRANITLALAMSMSLAACGADSSSDASSGSQSSSDAASGEKVVKIGVFEPATGDSGAGGKQEMLGMQYANKETPTVDIGGTTYNVELVYADNGSTTDKAPTAAAELVSKDVSLVLGSYGSSVAMAGGPVFDEAGLAAIGVTCTNPNITAGNDYYFRICFLDNFQAQVLVNFAKDKFSAQKAYCLGELGNEYDQGLIAFFEQNFDGEVIKDSFPTNTSDFSTYLAKAKDQGAEVIFCPVSIAYATQIIKLAASMGLEIPILGSDTLDSNKVLEAAAGSDVQLYVSTFYQEGGSPEFDEGIKA